MTDPTQLTTEALERGIGGLERLLESKIEIGSRICEEQFNSVGVQFALIERQRVEQKADTKQAVDAALAAAKEAVKEQTSASEKAIQKSETATSEQLKQLTTTFDTGNEGLRREIADLKERLTTSEQLRKGGQQAYTGIYAFIGAMASLLVITTLAAAVILK